MAEDTRTQEQKRADRQYAGKRQQEFIDLISRGADAETLAASGFRPEKGGGQFHFSNLDLASAIGPVGMYSGLKVDILNKMMGEPDGKGGVIWRPMTGDELRSINDYQGWLGNQHDKMGGGFATAFNPGYGSGAFQGFLREQQLGKDVGGGHLLKDPKSGFFYNPGKTPENKATWEWYDQFGRRSKAPEGFGAGLPTPAPTNPYPFDTAPWENLPAGGALPLSMSSTSAPLGYGGAWGGEVTPSGFGSQPSPTSQAPKPSTPTPPTATPSTPSQPKPQGMSGMTASSTPPPTGSPGWGSYQGITRPEGGTNFATLGGPMGMPKGMQKRKVTVEV